MLNRFLLLATIALFQPLFVEASPLLRLPGEKRSPVVLASNSPEPGITVMNFRSQQWRGIEWKHELTVLTPPKLQTPKATLLYVMGSKFGNEERQLLADVARRANVRTAALTMVPNQPLFNGLKEDSLLAFTFAQYRKTADPTWPVIFPMVRSVMSAMDVLTQNDFGEQFILTGASKRGWTAWLTGAIDKRVVGIAPAVFDMLNMPEQLDLMRTAYGKESEMIRDYTALGLTASKPDERLLEMRSWVDPLTYKDRLKVPKLIILGTNDPYWVVDSANLYWDEIPGPKLLLELPNVRHGALTTAETAETLGAWTSLLISGVKPPSLSWRWFENENKIHCALESDSKLSDVTLWSALSESRDFRASHWQRMENAEWKESTVTGPKRDGNFVAYLVTARIALGKDETMLVSTSPRVFEGR